MKASLPFPFTEHHPRFRIPGWSVLLGPERSIEATEMARHFLITGETGSGKSASAVMRLLEGILRYPEDEAYRVYADALKDKAEPRADLKPAVLVVDPKRELAEIALREAHGRRLVRIAYGENGPVLHLFEGQDMEKLGPFEVMDLILGQSNFYTLDQQSTREPIWNLQAASALRDLVSIDMWLMKRGRKLVPELWDGVRKRMCGSTEYASFLGNLNYDAVNYFKPHSTLMSLCGEDSCVPLACYLDAADKLKVPGELKARLFTLMSLTHTTRSGVVWMINGILSDLSSEELASCVSLNPLEAPPADRMLSVKDVLEKGDLVVYVPTASPIADIVGRCLKSKFFEFAFERENKVRPFFYVVDEAHRFITAGEKDGEQSLLDRCRAYRTGVVLATQSLASMAYRLDHSAAGKNSLQIIVNNCGNALYFRTTDIQTQENVEQRIPGPPVPNRPHVVKVRPLSSLGVGQCYALRCDGTWGLFKVQLSV